MNTLTRAVVVWIIVLLLPVVCVAEIVELPKCNARISGDLKRVRIQEGEGTGQPEYHQYLLGIQPTSYNDFPGRIVTINATKVGYLQRTKAFLKDQSVIVASVVGPVNAIGERENQIFESFMFW